MPNKLNSSLTKIQSFPECGTLSFVDGQLREIFAYSKWIEAIPVQSSTSGATIRVLRQLFATHGIPETTASDNGTQFVSEEFFNFLTNNGVEHIQTAPKHPSSNGLAERAVQTVSVASRR